MKHSLSLSEWLGADGEWVKLSALEGVNKKMISLLNDRENANNFINEIEHINRNCQQNKEGNPICSFALINGELCVRTFQYVAEFEVQLSKNIIKVQIHPRDLVGEETYKRMIELMFNIYNLGEASGKGDQSFVLLFYLGFIQKLEIVLNQGLYQEYIQREENLPYFKERLLVSEHLRRNFFSRDKLYCEFSVLSCDNIINQTIRYTLKVLQHYSCNYPPFYHKIRKLLNLLQEQVTDCKISCDMIENIHYNRFNKQYEEVMKYCKIILRKIEGASYSKDNALKYFAFYIDMNELFEVYFWEKLKQYRENNDDRDNDCASLWREIVGENMVGDWAIRYQETVSLDEGEIFRIRPDFIIKKGEDVFSIIDTKYKRLTNLRKDHFGISQADIYQVLAYAQRFKAESVYLIYPLPTKANFNEYPKHEIKINDITIHTRCVNLLN